MAIQCVVSMGWTDYLDFLRKKKMSPKHWAYKAAKSFMVWTVREVTTDLKIRGKRADFKGVR